jgi:hydrogenase maturation protease
MKPILVIGLGNELMGDDCIGCRLVEWLALDDALRDGMEFIEGGSDVLSLATRMEGRERVVLIDAVLSDDEPGTVSVDEEPFEDFEVRWEHVHGPSAIQAVGLLKALAPALRATAFSLVSIAVPEIRFEDTLTARFPEIATRVRAALVAHAGTARRVSS